MRVKGDKFSYTLKKYEEWAIYKGLIIIVHPVNPPKVIDEEGNITELMVGTESIDL